MAAWSRSLLEVKLCSMRRLLVIDRTATWVPIGIW